MREEALKFVWKSQEFCHEKPDEGNLQLNPDLEVVSVSSVPFLQPKVDASAQQEEGAIRLPAV